MIVGDGALLEGDEVLIIQRILALAADHDEVAQFQPHPLGSTLVAIEFGDV